MKITLIVASTALLLAVFTYWQNDRLEAQHETYSALEECIQREYGSTPAAFYQAHGYVPECR